MTGAIVPSDWDGSTFDCLKIKWPASEQWRAFLLGQATEMAQNGYWDASVSTDEEIEEAILAVETAYKMTLQELGDNCNVNEVRGFQVKKTASQSLTQGINSIVSWQAPIWETPNAGFNYTVYGHSPMGGAIPPAEIEKNEGLWVYTGQVAFQDYTGRITLTVTGPPGMDTSNFLFAGGTNYYQLPVVPVIWPNEPSIGVLRLGMLLLDGNGTIEPSTVTTWWAGYKVGNIP